MTAAAPAPTTLDLTAGPESAMARRLRAVAPLLLGSEAIDPPSPVAVDGTDPDAAAADAGASLDRLVDAVATSGRRDHVWLLLTALAGAYPTRSEVDRLTRQLELQPHRTAMIFALELAADIAGGSGDPEADLEVVVGAVLVDVDHSAKFDLHTGIQRVVRSLLPEWQRRHELVPVAWNGAMGALRRLDPQESARVFEWSDDRLSAAASPAGVRRDRAGHRLPASIVVPWRSVLVVPEVPPGPVCDRLGAIGDLSGNRLVGIVHDAIPVVSADMVPSPDSSKFVRFLTAIKFAHRLAGVSNSATAELAGFSQALRTQGLRGPVVTEVPLPTPTPDERPAPTAVGARPLVLVVGSHEPRKNHLAVLHAAELLWRDGLPFDLLFIGGSGWGDAFPRRVDQLRSVGRTIQVRRAVSDGELDRAYRRARFTVFPSLHEGFGLPVAESLAHGTPVITSDFGSVAEIGAAGGALLVDPRDDHALAAAMRTLLTDPATVERLVAEIHRRPHRTWTDYADELWAALVAPELASPQEQP